MERNRLCMRFFFLLLLADLGEATKNRVFIKRSPKNSRFRSGLETNASPACSERVLRVENFCEVSIRFGTGSFEKKCFEKKKIPVLIDVIQHTYRIYVSKETNS